MLIVCPACVSSYKVDLAALGRAGAAPRCAHCRAPLSGASAGPPDGTDRADATAFPPEPGGSAGRGIAVVCLTLAVTSATLFWREPIARAVPGAAAAYRMAGVPTAATTPVVRDLRTELTPEGLTVEGTLANPHHTRMALSRLHLSVRDGADGTLASWTAPPPKTSLGPGETVFFTSRLDKPPAQAHELAVSFSADRVAVQDGQ